MEDRIAGADSQALATSLRLPLQLGQRMEVGLRDGQQVPSECRQNELAASTLRQLGAEVLLQFRNLPAELALSGRVSRRSPTDSASPRDGDKGLQAIKRQSAVQQQIGIHEAP